MRGCEQWPLPDLETKSGIVLFFQLKHKHKPAKETQLVWTFRLWTNYGSCGFCRFSGHLYRNGPGGITHMTLEWKEPNKSQLWWRDLVKRESRAGCLICTIPFPPFPRAFSTGGTKQPWAVKAACLWLVLLKSQLCSWQWRIICTLFILPPTSFSTTRLSDCSPAGSQQCILPHLAHLIQLNKQLLSSSSSRQNTWQIHTLTSLASLMLLFHTTSS